MKKFLTASAILAVAFTATAKLSPSADSHGYPINPVSFTKVKVTDSFWGRSLLTNARNQDATKISERRQILPTITRSKDFLLTTLMSTRPSRVQAICCRHIPTNALKTILTACLQSWRLRRSLTDISTHAAP